MTLTRSIAACRRVFYGWWIVSAFGCLYLLGSGFFYYGLGTFFLPLTLEFGWSRALTSSAFSLYRLEGGVIAPIVGFAFDRLGPRKLVILGVALAGAGFVYLSQIDSFFGFALSVLIIAAGFSCGYGGIGMATVATWFVRKRSLALGLLMTGSGIGGLLVPLLAWMIETYGWRGAAVTVGVILWATGFPLAMVMRHRPESCGLLPDGDRRPPPTASSRSAVRTGPSEHSLGVKQALRSHAFWLLSLSASLTMVSQSAVMVHLIPRLTSVEISATLAATVLSAMTIVSIVGRLGFGWLGDRMQKRRVMAIVLGLQTAGLAIFAMLSEPWLLIPFLVLYAPSYGGAIPLRSAMLADYFGRASFGSIQGVFMGCTSVGGIVGPILAGWVYDTAGSYDLAFWILAAVTFVAVPAVLAAPLPSALRPATRKAT